MRLPFDPDQARGPERDDDAPLSVSQLAELIRGTLERQLPAQVRVAGEVSNLRVQDHWFFSLKDAGAVVSCVAWATDARRFRFRPDDGDEVVATGHVSHFVKGGRTQLYVKALQPVGAGELELRFRAMCEELRRLGYFDDGRKQPTPAFPRRVAVITSAHGAALQDVVSTARQRCPAVGLVVVDARVQGDGAAQDVARAVRWVDSQRDRLGVDVILVTRGGGSMEDLWAFNERVVADAIADCSLPVVAAIGHESDTTVAELVADVRAATPTQAAMRMIPDGQELRTQVEHLEHRLAFLVQRSVEQASERLRASARHLRASLRGAIAGQHARFERLAGRWSELKPAAVFAARSQRVAVLDDRLHRAVAARHATCRTRIDQVEQRLDAVDPRRVLARGFSYTMLESGADPGTLIRSAGDVRDGDRLVTHVADGRIRSVVGGSAPSRTPPRAPARRRRSEPEMDLFS